MRRTNRAVARCTNFYGLTLSAVALVTLFASSEAAAQSQPQPGQTQTQPTQTQPQPATMGTLTEVVVTGTHILGADEASANPISVATAQQIAMTDATTIEDFVRKMPSIDFTNGVTSGSNDTGLGASFAGLRNLGPQRTLVLVNGQRYPLTDIQGSYDAVDLNDIPVPLIKNVVVLRDGASSVYGADAIGGVINIITKQNFSGLEVGGSVGDATEGSALGDNAYVLLGFNTDRGNILIYASADKNQEALSGARAWSGDQYPNAGVNAYPNLSSKVSGAVGVIGGNNWYFPSGLNSGILAQNAYTLGSTQVSPGVWTGGGLTPYDLAIAGQGVYLQFDPNMSLWGGLNRRSLDMTSHYEITPNITGLVEAFYTDRTATQQLNPTQTGADTSTINLPNGIYSAGFLPSGACNPYNPTCGATPAQQALINSQYGITGPQDVPLYTRLFEVGDRYFNDYVSTYRIRVGLEGTVLSHYSFQVGYLYGQSAALYKVDNDINFEHLAQELGMTPCGTEAGCSLANFFGYNSLTPAQASYLRFTNTDNSQYSMSVAYGNITGPIIDLPAGTAKASVGVEYRTDKFFNNPDSIAVEGDAFSSEAPTYGKYATKSVYTEFDIPVLKNVPLAKSLAVIASGRYDDNTVFGSAKTFKLGLNWAITPDLRLRGSLSTGFRAPQLVELFAGQFRSNPGGFDPCAVGGAYIGSPTCVAAITAAGGNPQTVQQINQINTYSGGNPGLKPETSRQYSFGAVLTPRFIPALLLTVDYYSININNEISSLDPNGVLNACYGDVPYVISQTQACSLVGPRLQGTGDLGTVLALNGNVYGQKTDGIDFHLGYSVDTQDLHLPAWGALAFSGELNYVMSDTISAQGVTIQQVGTYTNDSAVPREKALLNLAFNRDNWSVAWTARYYGGIVNSDPTSACQFGTVPCTGGSADFYFPGNYASGIWYHDLAASYKYKSLFVSVGVDNLFDRDPPFIQPNGQLDTLGSAGYDIVGRYVYTKISLEL